ncbi:hypothetical protein DFQ30_005328, partial [Apophysomyces sp. BC1015]
PEPEPVHARVVADAGDTLNARIPQRSDQRLRDPAQAETADREPLAVLDDVRKRRLGARIEFIHVAIPSSSMDVPLRSGCTPGSMSRSPHDADLPPVPIWPARLFDRGKQRLGQRHRLARGVLLRPGLPISIVPRTSPG